MPCLYIMISTYENSIWISHWPIPNVQPPSHSQSLRQSLCGRVGSTKWRAVIGLCVKQPQNATTLFTCTALILARAFCAYVCSDVNRTAILNWGPIGQWTSGRVRLASEPAFCAFGNALCGMSHGGQHKTASPHAVKALMTNVWL